MGNGKVMGEHQPDPARNLSPALAVVVQER